MILQKAIKSVFLSLTIIFMILITACSLQRAASEDPTPTPTTMAIEEESPEQISIAFLEPPFSKGKLLYHSDQGGSFDIYVMENEAAGIKSVTDHPRNDLDPAWSPDGEKIAFMSDREGNFDIFLLGAAGGELMQLTADPGADVMPAWSPAGETIAFSSTRDGNFEIYFYHLNEDLLQRITQNNGDDRGPAWSPDGERIAFHSNRDGDWEIYLINIDGSGLERITTAPGVDGFPAWSPDGYQLAFSSNRSGNFDIYVYDLRTQELVSYALSDGDDRAPAWLPDGSGIAFMSDYFGNWEILGLLVEDGSFFRITDRAAEDGFPDLIAMTEKAAPPEDSAVAIQAFLNEYNQFFRDQNPEALLGLLHPAVINLYGAETCQNYLNTIVSNPIELELVAVSESYLWIWEIDGRSTEIDNAYTLQVILSTADQDSEQEIHLAKFGEDLIGWFTDCGEPTS